MTTRTVPLRSRSPGGDSLTVLRDDWDNAMIAVVICDMWDTIQCVSAARRVAEMAARVNEVAARLRRDGALIVHAPAGCMDYYAGAAARDRARQARPVQSPVVSYPLCRDLQEQERIFDGVLCRYPTTVNLSIGQEPQPVGAEIVSGSYFSVLGVRPESGRLIDESDDVRPGAHPVVVLSYDYWQSSLGGAADVVGSTVRVKTTP